MLLTLCACVVPDLAQTWVSALKTAPLDDNAQAVTWTDGWRVIVAGISRSDQRGDDGVVGQLDASGSVMWSFQYGGEAVDLFQTIVSVPGRGYWVAGSSNSFSDRNDEGWIVMIGRDGAVKWSRTYGGSGQEVAIALSRWSDGSFLAAGRTNDFSQSHFLAWKMDERGNVIWHHTYGIDTESEFLHDGIATSDGGALLVGSTSYGQDYQDNALAMKIDSTGSVEWQRMYSMQGDEAFFSAVEIGDGFVVVGEAGTGHSGLPRGFLARLDTDGNVVWHREYPVDSLRGGRLYAVTMRGDGSVMAAGEYFANGAQTPDAWLISVDGADGEVLWQRTYGAFDLERIEDLACTSVRGCVFAGITRSYSSGQLFNYNDVFAIRTDDRGEVATECSIAQARDDPGEVVALQSEAYPAVAGELVDFVVQEPSLGVVSINTSRERICMGSTLFPPTEVSPAESQTPLHFTDASDLEWEAAAASASDTFDLYRGDVTDLAMGRAGECLATGLTAPVATDGELPAPAQAWFYLVGGVNAAGWGPLGVASDGAERQAATYCP